jgi:uncharacterized protein
MLSTAIPLPVAAIREYCRTQPIDRLSVFGSVLRDDFTPESDVDLLVVFTPGARVTYFDMHYMQEALTEMIGRRVDLRTPKELSRYFVDDVLARAQVIYERE